MACSSSDREQTDPVKQPVAAHWDRRAAHFDEDLGHSIQTAAERATWDRILDLTLPAADALEALDIGCGTGFLSLELAFLGHRVTGVDFAPSMIAQARKKGGRAPGHDSHEEADAELLPFAAARFDIAASRHLLWTLPDPERAMDEWIRVLRPGGRLIIVNSQADVSAPPEPLDTARGRPNTRRSAIGDRRSATGSGFPVAGRARRS
jgi:ubiquinone/menaquinone biosynthesis C-methylase UbiE